MAGRSLVLLGLLGATAVTAHPYHQPQIDPSGSSVARRGIDLTAFAPPARAEYVNSEGTASKGSLKLLRRETYVETASAVVKEAAPNAQFRVVEDHYVGTNGVAHVNFKQTVNGIDIDNADFNVNIAADGSVLSYGNSFYTGELPSSLTRREDLNPVAALDQAVTTFQLPIENAAAASAEPTEGADDFVLTGTNGAQSDPKARLVYLVKSDNSLALTWRVETDVLDDWLLTYVDAENNSEVHSVVNYVAEAGFQVYPWGVNDPTEGSRVTLTDPANQQTSEFGWFSTGTTSYTTTRGNNAIAQENRDGDSAYLNNYRPTSSSLNFSYPYSLTQTDYKAYQDASIAQLFYTANTYHDVLYTLGFTEAAGNFELNNNGQGGKGNDDVTLNAQDGAFTNNADFATPADGSKPRMRMYIWTKTTPYRDCTFEAGVVIHEYTHGLSNRLTGGPANSGCLSSTESGGMGEGWGDYMATAIRLKASDTAATSYTMGAWVNGGAGIRAYPYSTSLTTNPQTYKTANGLSSVHAIGTIWANMLYEMTWGLIAKYGKSVATFPTFDSKGVPTDGKFLAMKLVVDAMALQPCNPNFVQARDAILDADKALTGGVNACIIWTAFAKRGLGDGARYSSSSRTESFTVKSGVC
ncbi:extracellular metallo proteinase MEP [Microdochium trichocladiopsis]|uniref:Extracellular metalloproteinase n=1 Tax=Microdochium trichocladiopsis TaxID=1682393 RepID=A0A9P8Y2E8_9PEZI|nr:extracellular metallo proteinase MEP [Microdochium trichocladiopsis]KAH7027945.1 extracellular metallo proteinase MEP [Microdochium trichocladiopsis]